MTKERGPHVLTVAESEYKWHKKLTRLLKDREIPHTAVYNADDAVKLLQEGTVTSVITEGLRGDWQQVIDQAREARATGILLSRSSIVVNEAKADRVPAFSINELSARGGTGKVINAALAGPRT